MCVFQDEVSVAGRICCDSHGKLNAKSVLLEGSRETSAGRWIPIDLSELKEYSLFPGQVKILSLFTLYSFICTFSSTFWHVKAKFSDFRA